MSQSYNYGDYNRGGMIAFAFSMIVTLVFFVYVAFIHSGVDLKETTPAEQPKVEAESEKMEEATEEVEEATEESDESAQGSESEDADGEGE